MSLLNRLISIKTPFYLLREVRKSLANFEDLINLKENNILKQIKKSQHQAKYFTARFLLREFLEKKKKDFYNSINISRRIQKRIKGMDKRYLG
jgi:hypothetical protein